MVQIYTHFLKCFRLDTSYGVKKNLSHANKRGSWYLLGVLVKLSKEHPSLFTWESPHPRELLLLLAHFRDLVQISYRLLEALLFAMCSVGYPNSSSFRARFCRDKEIRQIKRISGLGTKIARRLDLFLKNDKRKQSHISRRIECWILVSQEIIMHLKPKYRYYLTERAELSTPSNTEVHHLKRKKNSIILTGYLAIRTVFIFFAAGHKKCRNKLKEKWMGRERLSLAGLTNKFRRKLIFKVKA